MGTRNDISRKPVFFYQLASEYMSLLITHNYLQEVLTRDIPYADIKSDFSVLRKIIDKELPRVVQTFQSDNHTDNRIMELCKQCWNLVPAQRPSAESLCGLLAPNSINFEECAR